MSALPPKADIGTRSRNVRFVPIADIAAKIELEAANGEKAKPKPSGFWPFQSGPTSRNLPPGGARCRAFRQSTAITFKGQFRTQDLRRARRGAFHPLIALGLSARLRTY